MRKLVILLPTIFFIKTTQAQYYFQDVVTAGNASKNFGLLKSNNIKQVTVTSIEPDGSETENFGIHQKVNAALNQLITETQSSLTGISIMVTSFNKQALPESIIDSSANTVNDVSYQYDGSGRLKRLSSQSREPNDTNRYTIGEEHLFEYDSKGQLIKMLRIKDKFDTLKVRFIPAENGLPGVEEWWKNNQKTESWYYYYNENNLLTDIVRFDKKYQKMLPDYVFEYNDASQLTNQTVVQPGTSFFRLWVYDYDERGLKKSETVFSKGKEQEGRIIYEYE